MARFRRQDHTPSVVLHSVQMTLKVDGDIWTTFSLSIRNGLLHAAPLNWRFRGASPNDKMRRILFVSIIWSSFDRPEEFHKSTYTVPPLPFDFSFNQERLPPSVQRERRLKHQIQ